MALSLNYSICVINNCTELRFCETTGIYSTSNLTGYGVPNDAVSDMVSAVLTITNPGGTSYNIDLFATGLFPSDNTSISYDIPLSGMGSPVSITDGKWTFVYTVVSGAAVTYTKTIFKYTVCNSECCVTKMQPTLDTCDSCIKTDNTTYLTAWSFLESLKKAASCGDEANFTAIKKIVDKLCLNSECKTCK